MSTVISLQNLSKWYGEVVGLNGVNAQITSGITGLLGPNGAGKTTLFRILTGMAYPSIGTATILGQSTWQNPDIFKLVGFCPEIDSFYEEMTGRRFVETMGLIHGLSHAQAKTAAEQALARLKLQELAQKRIGEMSKGMRQRIKMAQSILHEPQVLLLDEPLTGMDPVLRHQTIEMIKAFAADGKTVLVSSHILHEVEQMTNNILLMICGKVLAQGSIREIRDHLNQHPRKIIIRTDAIKPVGNECLNAQGVVSVRVDSANQLLVETLQPLDVLHRLTQGAAMGKYSIQEVYTSDEDLESVFELLVG